MAIAKEIEALNGQRRTRAARRAYDVAYGVSEGTPVNARIQLRGDVLARQIFLGGGDLVAL